MFFFVEHWLKTNRKSTTFNGGSPKVTFDILKGRLRNRVKAKEIIVYNDFYYGFNGVTFEHKNDTE